MATLVFAGCTRLDVRSEYLYPNYLASARMNTPDPSKGCFTGQQLVVYWNLWGLAKGDYSIQATIRYGNHEIAVVEQPLTKRYGYWLYRVLNAEYWEKGGILSFKVELYRDGELVLEKRHHLWADLIEIQPDLCE